MFIGVFTYLDEKNQNGVLKKRKILYNDGMIKNRLLSFAVIAAVYALAIEGGIFGYDWIRARYDLSWQLALLAADVFATAIVFAFSVIFGNASVYDPY